MSDADRQLRSTPGNRVILRLLPAPLLFGLLAVGCSRAPVEEVPVVVARPHVVVVSLDTLRADRVGAVGSDLHLTPALDRLAEQSLVFTRAYSTAPWTLPAHASLLTGLYPDEHGAGYDAGRAPLRGDVPTVAERFREAGYRTVALTAGGLMAAGFGLERGFDEWRSRPRRDLESRIPEAVELLSDGSRPVLLLLHAYDVHGPYPSPGDGETLPDVPAELEDAWARLEPPRIMEYLELDRFASLAELVGGYDEGVRRTDRVVGRFVEQLKSRDLLDSTVLVVLSDHGESLFEQRLYVGHGVGLSEEEVRIPLIVRLPGAASRGTRDELVDLTDVAALLLGRASLDASGLSGTDPLESPGDGLVRGSTINSATHFAFDGRWKLLTAPDLNRAGPAHRELAAHLGGLRLYDLERDPEERRNLFDPRHRDLDARRLAKLLATLPRFGRHEGRGAEVSPELEEQLRALGYVE